MVAVISSTSYVPGSKLIEIEDELLFETKLPLEYIFHSYESIIISF